MKSLFGSPVSTFQAPARSVIRRYALAYSSTTDGAARWRFFVADIIMKTLCAAVSLIALAACTREPINAAGIYRLSTGDKSMVLEVRTGGEYVLQINGTERNPDQIRGRWEDERGPGPNLSLHGIIWQGTEPTAGHGVWAATVQSNGDICLDGEGLSCFTRDDAS